jgi:hypothetical protein
MWCLCIPALLAVTDPAAAQSRDDRVESGVRLRVELHPPPPLLVEGLFWRQGSEGLTLQRNGAPDLYAWDRIERVEVWRESRLTAKREAVGAAVGAIYLGASTAKWFSGPEGAGAGKGAVIGGLLGAGLGWIVAHAIFSGEGRWVPVRVESLRGLR